MMEYHHTLKDPVTCHASNKLKEVLKKIVDERVHRVFVVDKVTKRLKGVVSLTDIIFTLAKAFTDHQSTKKSTEKPKEL